MVLHILVLGVAITYLGKLRKLLRSSTIRTYHLIMVMIKLRSEIGGTGNTQL
jgi:hypothetical protein